MSAADSRMSSHADTHETYDYSNAHVERLLAEKEAENQRLRDALADIHVSAATALDGTPSAAQTPGRHGHEWNAKHCEQGHDLAGCHGCCELRCLTCDPYTDYERLNRCCVSTIDCSRVPAREQEGRADTRPSTYSSTPSAAQTLEDVTPHKERTGS